MKAGKKEKTCLLGITGKCSVKASVHIPVKGKKDESPEPASVIREIKGKRNCLLDGEEKNSCKSTGLFLGDGKVRGKSALFNRTLTLLNTPWRQRKYSWRME